MITLKKIERALKRAKINERLSRSEWLVYRKTEDDYREAFLRNLVWDMAYGHTHDSDFADWYTKIAMEEKFSDSFFVRFFYDVEEHFRMWNDEELR